MRRGGGWRDTDDKGGNQLERRKEVEIRIFLLFYKIMVSYDGYTILFY